MYRTIEERLMEWKHQSNKKPLIIQGARQVGKTFIVEKFAQENYKTCVEINFQLEHAAKEFFSVPHSYEEMLHFIEINNIEKDFTDPKNVLVFFDEIQEVPQLITALKVFKLKCPYDVICSGSMLGVTLNRVPSFPVGYVDNITMYPLSFKEFVIANGMDRKYVDLIKESVEKKEAVSPAIHDKFNELYNLYLVVGGLPEAVQAYVDTKSIAQSTKVLKRLSQDYKGDIATYADRSVRLKALECYESLPIQLAKDNKKFQYKLVRDGYNARYYDTSLAWLENGGLTYKVNRLKTIDDPLSVYVEMPIFKVYSFDTGILASWFDESVITQILEDALQVYKGVIYENSIAILLKQNGYASYYFEPSATSEIDFVTYYKGQIVPIEVKGGLHKKSKSFTSFIKKYNTKLAFRVSKRNIGYEKETNTYFLPHYALAYVLEEKWI